MTALKRWVGWAVPATPQERAAALWSFAYFFMLLAGYYVLRPLRDQMGIAGGVKNLPWLFTATFVTLIVARSTARWWRSCRADASSPSSITSSSPTLCCSGCC
jgi:ATP/ADP translocase